MCYHYFTRLLFLSESYVQFWAKYAELEAYVADLVNTAHKLTRKRQNSVVLTILSQFQMLCFLLFEPKCKYIYLI